MDVLVSAGLLAIAVSDTLAVRLGISLTNTDIAQTEKLQALIRLYCSQRHAPRPTERPNGGPPATQSSEPNNKQKDEDVTMDKPSPPVPPGAALAPNNGEAQREGVEEMGIPQPDGASGMVLPPLPEAGSEEEVIEEVEGRREFPRSVPRGESFTAAKRKAEERTRPNRSHHLLPEIGRLAREIVRNGEEKVAVAVGAYNSVSPLR